MTALDYIKYEEKEKEEKQVFELVLVYIRSPNPFDLKCVKKNMYDQDLKYIAISYRWGELEEQLIKTPDYTAHITSFDLYDLANLCIHIQKEHDLKDIHYLWVDAISVDQYNNHERKKETILKMSEIYKKATYILAVPDLHLRYLRNNPANTQALYLIQKHRETIYQAILNSQTTNKNENANKLKKKVRGFLNYLGNIFQSNNKKDIKIAYEYLAYLIEDWSNRAWVISEYHIAKIKEENQGTPLKFTFISLLNVQMSYFISYKFDYDNINLNIDEDGSDNEIISYKNVDSSSKFINFLKTRFTQRQHLHMLLGSNASRNEDRFNAILPSWNKYNHLIKDKNTISNWHVTDMISVRLKLYEIMDDLWDKAVLLQSCSPFKSPPILPSFACHTDINYLFLIEKDNLKYTYESYLSELEDYAFEKFGNDDSIQQYILDDNDSNEKIELLSSSLYTENLMDIQLNTELNCLSIKAKKYFIFKIEEYVYDQETFLSYSLKIDDDLKYLYVPFFTFAVPDFAQALPWHGSGILLIGNMIQNRWVLVPKYNPGEKPEEYICYSDDYTLNIY
ncbi:unnamed protein product [Cunninghamella echinulata]